MHIDNIHYVYIHNKNINPKKLERLTIGTDGV